MGSAVKFRNLNVARQVGELARLKVVQGPDYGTIYVLLQTRATIGRGEENDVVISDLKSSRLHAEVSFLAGTWMVRDKESANGILHNGKATREARLKVGDTITIGETTLEFASAEAGTFMLVAPPRTPAQIQSDQMQRDQVGNFGIPRISSVSDNNTKTSKNRLPMIIGVVALLGAGLWMLPDGKSPSKNQKKVAKDTPTPDLEKYLPNTEANRAADTLFKDGFREYLAGNYNRARVQFETVLQISPSHTLANRFKVNCDQAVEEEVKVHIKYGKKSHDAGKLKDAKAHYERVLRLLYKDQSSPAYIEAKQEFDAVIKEMNTWSDRL